MKKLAAAITGTVLLVPGPLAAATRDRTSPTVRYRTANHSILLSNPAGVRSDEAQLLEVIGTATDAGVGIKSVSVTWLRCTYGSSTGCVILGPPVTDPTPSTVQLACSRTRRSCTWRATTPSLPGAYVFAATAKDKSGNVSHHSGLLDLTVL